mmetsp:Transcript_18785/g.54089  ORF Transcript_18785/g.54089 Transcript_18785/m.54089 type:complete len:220 (+) Transcript_18785:641-1300(+)
MRLEIPVQDAVGMAESDATENLLHERLDHGLRQSDALIDVIARLILIHEGLEIVCHKFKHQIQAAGLGLDDVQELDDVGVVQLAKERDFANDVAGNTALGRLISERDAFDGNLLVCRRPIAAVDHTVRSLPNNLGSLVTVQAGLVVQVGLRSARIPFDSSIAATAGRRCRRHLGISRLGRLLLTARRRVFHVGVHIYNANNNRLCNIRLFVRNRDRVRV